MRSRLILLLAGFTYALFGAGGIAAAQSLSTQSSGAAGVTVKATPRALTGGAWEFEIVFDTHTQELNDDLVKTASLLADGKPLAPAGWPSSQRRAQVRRDRSGAAGDRAADTAPRRIRAASFPLAA